MSFRARRSSPSRSSSGDRDANLGCDLRNRLGDGQRGHIEYRGGEHETWEAWAPRPARAGPQPNRFGSRSAARSRPASPTWWSRKRDAEHRVARAHRVPGSADRHVDVRQATGCRVGQSRSTFYPNSPTLNADGSASTSPTTRPPLRWPPRSSSAGRVHRVDMAGQRVRDQIRNEAWRRPRCGCRRALLWKPAAPALRRTGARAGDGPRPRRRRRGTSRVRLHGCCRPPLRRSRRSRHRVGLGDALRYAAAPSRT